MLIANGSAEAFAEAVALEIRRRKPRPFAAFRGDHRRAPRGRAAPFAADMRDMPRPVKSNLPEYKAIEQGIMAVVAQRFDFTWPMSLAIKDIDERIGLAEQQQNMGTPPAAWCAIEKFDALDPLPVHFKYWSPDEAMAQFVRTAEAFGVRA